MSQTIADREALIARLERDALAHPKVYRWKVTALAVLGFFYIGLIMSLTTLGLLAIGFALFAVPSVLVFQMALVLGVPLFYLGWGCLRALRVPFPPPVGDRLEPAAHPELFARIEKIRAELDGPTVHEVLLVPDLNAAIVGVPRLGLFGWHKNYMLLGLDLLAIMSDDEFDSVIAHEMGHLSGKHGKVSAWIYRVRRTWFQIAENAATDGGPSFAFRRFFNWFIPYFSAYSFVLARMHEYEADAAAAKVTSPEVAGRALCRVEAAATHLGEVFWPQIHERAKSSTEPPRDLYHALRTVTRGVEAELVTGYVSDALSRRPTFDDTHPSLAQRLTALGVEPARLQPPARLAGDAYLGAQFEAKLQLFSEKWADEVAESWNDAARPPHPTLKPNRDLPAHPSPASLAPCHEYLPPRRSEPIDSHTRAAGHPNRGSWRERTRLKGGS